MKYTVDIGIACSGSQKPSWWSRVFAGIITEIQSNPDVQINRILTSSSALPDHNKNNTIGAPLQENAEQKKRNELTDANRNSLVHNFWNGNEAGSRSDWLFQIDDDTVPPILALGKLLKLDKPFVAGLYFNGNPPYNPIAYMRDPSGFGYRAVYDYPYGSLMAVDSVGMGCTLIHRSVFEKIRDGHKLYQRPNGTLMPVLRSKIGKISPILPKRNDAEEFVTGGWYCAKLQEPAEDDNRSWPYYAMEYCRTEDHYFCELAAAVGIKPWIDTSITCDHIKDKGYGYEDYKQSNAIDKGLIQTWL